jgi:ATP-dependent Zn protease
MIMALAFVLWQMASKPDGQKSASAMSYSDFMNQVDKSNVATAKLFDLRETAEIEGQLCQPPGQFKVTVPKEVIPELTERLRKQGVTIVVTGGSEPTWESELINFSPIILIVGIWIYMMKHMQNRRNPPSQGGPANGALG